MKSSYHVVIIGGGAGGLAAAERLLGHGLDILLLDENMHLGGQLLRKVEKHYPSNLFAKFDPDRAKNRGFDLVKKVTGEEGGITILNRVQVLGISDGKVLVEMPGTFAPGKQGRASIGEFHAEYIILATGVRERYLPFKGWTLPGVISLGAAQILMKSHGVLPGTSTIIGGSSPLMLVLAAELLKNNGKVPVLLDENGFHKKSRFLPLVKDHWPKLIEGAYYTAQMMLHRTPLIQNMRIVEARGSGGFKSVVAAKTDHEGKVIFGSEKEYRGDTLAVGYGFVPNIELPAQAGIELCFRRDRGGWIVKVNEMLETSLPFIYAVGEITGVAGAKKSMVEGKLAALSILKKMDLLGSSATSADFQREVSRLVKIDRQQQQYGSFLGQFCNVDTEVYKSIPDETIICRCEGITMGEVRKNIELGFDTLGGLKKATRSGMGRCQGRICSPVITDIVTALTGKTPARVGAPHARIPVKNVALGSFG